MNRIPPVNSVSGKNPNELSDADNGNSKESSSVKEVNVNKEMQKSEAGSSEKVHIQEFKRTAKQVGTDSGILVKKQKTDSDFPKDEGFILNGNKEIQDLASLKHESKNREELLDLYAKFKNSKSERECKRVKKKILGKEMVFPRELLLGKILCHHIEKKNIYIKNVDEKTFKKEMLLLLKDLNSRGITNNDKLRELDMRSVGDFTRGDSMSGNGMSRLREYYKYYDDIHDFDLKLDKYVLSDDCEKWKENDPLYRGGDATFERKTIRNLEKGKPAFRKEYINRGGVVFGYGQYYTNNAKYAEDKKNPVILRVNLKENIPLIRSSDASEIFGGVGDKNKLSPKKYISNFAKHELVVCHGEAEPDSPGEIFTLTSGGGINRVNMTAVGDVVGGGGGPKSHGELSIQRLDSNRGIVGSPLAFELVQVDKDDVEPTDYIAHGYSTDITLPVFKYKDIYIAPSPEKKGDYFMLSRILKLYKVMRYLLFLSPPKIFFILIGKIIRVCVRTNFKIMKKLHMRIWHL